MRKPLSNAALAANILLASLCGCQGRREEALPEKPKGPVPYVLEFPLGLQAESAVIPADNQLTLEKVRLGKRLFFDKRLSLDDSISCAGCHLPEKAFADVGQFSEGVGGRKGDRNAPTLVNRVFSGAQFWDGRAASLEEQATGPVQNPVEMAMPDMATLVGKIQADPEYVKHFRAAFPGEPVITDKQIGKAIASFERTILSGNSPYDRFMAGDPSAMSESARRGMAIFKDGKRGNCETCHVSFNFTDENYNNIGVGMASETPDLGRYRFSRLEGHQGAFKTPTLREIAITAPYMHDGSQKTLEEVVRFYEQGGHRNMWLSPKIRRSKLTQREREDLIAFMESLSGEVTWYGKDESR